jgi:hypothetical protein
VSSLFLDKSWSDGVKNTVFQGLQAPRILLDQLLKVAEVGLGPSPPKKAMVPSFPLSKTELSSANAVAYRCF